MFIRSVRDGVRGELEIGVDDWQCRWYFSVFLSGMGGYPYCSSFME